jgi:8-oxo-dGTP pyrophosphatase MutT (NUDIX family)
LNELRAAVALVLRRRCASDGNTGVAASTTTELLLIRRAVSERDPWSGDVALPGGKVEEGETDLEAAIRECKEEVNNSLLARPWAV